MRHEFLPLELYKKAETGDRASRNKIVEYHLPMVKKIVERYEIKGYDREDLVQEGALALIRAVEKFDWRKGYGFSTYAMWWLRHKFDSLVKKKRLATDLVGDEWYRDTEEAASELTNLTTVLQQIEDESLVSEVDKAILELPDIQKSVITLKHGMFGFEPQTISRISEILQVTKEEVRKCLDEAEESIRSSNLGEWL